MAQSGKLVMIAALRIKQSVMECLLFVCLHFHMLGFSEIPSAALYFAKRKSEFKIQNKTKVKHKTKKRFITLLSYANVAVK